MVLSMGGNTKKSNTAKREEEILSFWQENTIFEETLKQTKETTVPLWKRLIGKNNDFVFYDGPPFATGLPHYGHLIGGTIKDVIPRYQTMRGRYVRRQWGWDCHGLPLENIVEKELELKSKKDIKVLGVDVFNETAKKSVLRYADDWKKIIPQVGRWVDMENDYRTMDSKYTESVWWAFSRLYKKGLVYKGFKSMHLCPRCETTLSNFEVTQGYADIKDFAVTVPLWINERENTALLIWTTTPWTLPGNVAAAVHSDIEYATVESEGKRYIVATERVSKVFDGKPHAIVSKEMGATLVELSYVPPFKYYLDSEIEGKKNAWKVYSAPYVSIDEGTGIVHLAPAFGAEDLELAQKYEIPIIHHVTETGVFADEVTDFKGLPVKPKGDHMKTDIEIIKHLAHTGALFEKEKITHSYPHCWRCDTPLLNYAHSSWFIRVTELKDKLVDANKKIHWVPKEIGTGRFGKWLEGARDWAVSRSRFWGAPLPVWESEDGSERLIIDSLDELKKHTKTSGNRYLLVRHGEAESNVLGIMSSLLDNVHHLTSRGIAQVEATAQTLKKEGVTRIVASPFLRTRESAEIIAETIDIAPEAIEYDRRLHELKVGVFEGKTLEEYHKTFEGVRDQYLRAPENGESLLELKRRVGEFLYDIESKYKDETILIVGHQAVLNVFFAVGEGANIDEGIAVKKAPEYNLANGEMKEFPFVPLPHNAEYELDYHLPYIDALSIVGAQGKALTRTPEVFDCWLESGSMPYAQHHYPFENIDVFNPERKKGFPADFIAEGLDQTRGWFYSLLVLSVGLFDAAPYKNVIVNGTILAEDGQKMSKRLNNYPDPLEIIQKYGADALRYYLMASPAVRGEDMNFSEEGVAEVFRKIIARLSNVVSFYELYAEETFLTGKESSNPLDQWILVRLQQTVNEVTDGLDGYELDRGARSIGDFIDDLSTWYIRRSRDRMKGSGEDAQNAIEILTKVLEIFARVIAPYIPFIAEDVYMRLAALVPSRIEKKSVHLANWPGVSIVDTTLLEKMKEVRRIVSEALDARLKAGVKVRQPLNELKIQDNALEESDTELHDLIKDEVNVKNISFDTSLNVSVWLDTELTPELKKEGQLRELTRAIQGMRKEKELDPGDRVVLKVVADTLGKELIEKNKEEIMKTTSLSDIQYIDSSDAKNIDLDATIVRMEISK
jgi:isoleucyl-tRNA synthetase